METLDKTTPVDMKNYKEVLSLTLVTRTQKMTIQRCMTKTHTATIYMKSN